MEEEIIERLDLKIAYLEQANNELSAVVYRQQLELDELRARLQLLQSRIDDAGGAATQVFDPLHERPPHY